MFILRKADIRMTIKLIDYLRGGETDIVPALLAALDSLPDGGTLELGGGTYHLFPGKALTKHYYISNNDAGDKPIAIPLIGKHDIMIDGGGAELIFHGGILPIVVDGSSDVTVKNITIDYAAPFFSQAEIISSDRYTTVLRFDGEEFGCTVAPDGRFRFVTHDPVTGETGHSDAESPLSLEFDSTLRDGFIPSPHKPPYFPDFAREDRSRLPLADVPPRIARGDRQKHDKYVRKPRLRAHAGQLSRDDIFVPRVPGNIRHRLEERHARGRNSPSHSVDGRHLPAQREHHAARRQGGAPPRLEAPDLGQRRRDPLRQLPRENRA